VLGALGVKCHTGADLAIDMADDRDIELPSKPYAVLVVREVRKNDVERQLEIAKQADAALYREMRDVIIVPFCAADEAFSRHVAKVCNDSPVANGVWKNPEKLQWLIANAEYVVSLGRLHPLVFALGARRPCFGVTYPWLTGYDKINGFMHHSALGHRAVDWGLPPGEIGAKIHDAVRARQSDKEIINVYSGYMKGLALESLCPIWTAMGAEHGLGIERGMKSSEFRVDDYDDTYFFGARVFRQPNGEFTVYHPTRGDWGEWDIIRDLIVTTMKPDSLIDIGCGRGWFLKRMVDAKVKAQGIDMSAAAWAECAPGMQEHIKVGRVNEVSHRRFDVVTAFDVMEHIYLEDLDEAVAAMKQAAGKYIVMNICAARDDEDVFTIKKGEPVPPELEWLAVSGHVTIRHRSWWKNRLEDEDWESDEDMTDTWFKDSRFKFPSWQRHNIVILKRRSAA
jgi:hypothetical protein